MGYSHYIGRVGALAITLGVGCGIGAPIVWADTSAPGATSETSAASTGDTGTSPTDTQSTDTATETTTADDGPSDTGGGTDVAPHHEEDDADSAPSTAKTDEVAPGVTISSSGGAKSSRNDDETDKRSNRRRGDEPTTATKIRDSLPTPSARVVQDDRPVRISRDPLRDRPSSPPAVVDASQFSVPTTRTADIQRVLPTPVSSVVTAVQRNVVAPILSTLLSSLPGKAADSPLGWVLLAAARRQFGQREDTVEAGPVAATSTAQPMLMTALAADEPEAMNAALDAAVPAADAVGGQVVEIGTVDDAGAVAVTATRAYVTNRSAGTVTVIDTVTNTVIRTIAVGPSPDDVVAKPDGTKLFVSSSENNTITVVNTTTGAVTATIEITNPTAMAINSSGSMLYVTTGSTGTMTKIVTATNAVQGVVSLPAGWNPTDVIVSPDKTKIYVLSTKADGGATVSVIGYTSSIVTTIADLATIPTDLAVSPDNKQLYVSSEDGTINVYNTTTRALTATHTVGGALVGVATDSDGSLLLATDSTGRVSVLDVATGSVLTSFATRASVAEATIDAAASPDGKRVYVSDYNADKVYVVTLGSANTAPTVGTPTINAPSETGKVTGNVVATDPDGDQLTYTVAEGPSNGSVTLSSTGAFTYTPTSTARHAASAVDAPPSALTDSFTVSVWDGQNPAVLTTVTVDISPANKVPVVSLGSTVTYASSGVVIGSVKSTDGDFDVRTYTATTLPTKGTVVVSATGGFTYTAAAEARHAAAKIGATDADTTDTFDVTVDDGHGGVVTITVTVAIPPSNAVPTKPTLGDSSTDSNTGVVTGAVNSSDANGDTLTYTAGGATKGELAMQPDGTFTYTPTMAARIAAAAPGASTADKTEMVTVTVTDGYGGVATSTLTLNIAPYVSGNVAPTNARADVSDPTSAIGAVTGTVTADDANGDTLTYVLDSAPTKGLVKLDAATGAFTYVPDVDARYAAAKTPAVDTDTFTVAISDGNGGWASVTVEVEIAPPAASSIDQRSTTVAIAASDMYFYSQADLNQAFGIMRDTGITSVRVMLPWAAIEPANNLWSWSRSDLLVNTANAYGIEIVAVLNTTPMWAATPNTPLYAGAPTSNQEFAQFASAVATRYQGKIAAYEVWNEPNAVTFWAPKPSAAQYTALLQAAYVAIKAADPDAIVVAAGIAPLVDFGTLTVNAVRYVEEMYLAGAAGYFDALAYHPYLTGKMFTEASPTTPNTPANQLQRIYQLMVANGDGNKKIWVTEYGQPSTYTDEAGQAAYLDNFLRAWRDLDYAGPAFIHTLRDYDTSNANQVGYGLLNLDWSPKAALSVVEDVIEENQAMLDLD